MHKRFLRFDGESFDSSDSHAVRLIRATRMRFVWFVRLACASFDSCDTHAIRLACDSHMTHMQFVRDRLAKGRPGSFLLIRLFLPTTQIIRSIARFASLCPFGGPRVMTLIVFACMRFWVVSKECSYFGHEIHSACTPRFSRIIKIFGPATASVHSVH